MSDTKQLNASMSVEAALLVPMMLFVLVAFLNLNFMIATQLQIQKSMQESMNHYLVSKTALSFTGDKIDEFVAKMIVDDNEYFDEDTQKELYQLALDLAENVAASSLMRIELQFDVPHLSKLPIQFGSFGVLMTCKPHYELYASERTMTVFETETSYQWKICILPGVYWKPKVKQRAIASTWQGRGIAISKEDDQEEQSSSEQMVYVTEFGSVYHTHTDCRYLDIAINAIPCDTIEVARNLSGKKYNACLICKKQPVEDGCYYVTNYGTAYHHSRYCSTIARNAKAIPISEVDCDQCSKCRERDEQ